VSVGFPGGEASYHGFFSSPWRYVYNLVVIVFCALAVLITVMLLRPRHDVSGSRLLRATMWLAAGMLTFRGVAGMVVDGTSDPIWWPMFLVGGLLMGMVAWLAHASTGRSHSGTSHPPPPCQGGPR
jgi:hypothetical protein